MRWPSGTVDAEGPRGVFFQRSLDIRLRLENVPSGGVNEVSRGGYVFSGKKCFYSSKGGGFNHHLYP